ncbi:MAG: outer membrane beta-barrel protein [Verrucomicrobiota bacterium]
MKKLAASIGLIALGSTCLHAADDAYSSADSGKIWKISASLRGFYDDNLNSVPSGSANRSSSFGFSLSPGGSLDWQRGSTTLLLSYRYSLLYYGVRPAGNNNNYDQDHNFDLTLNHVINERYRFRVSDSFVIGQEPDSLRSKEAVTTSQRVPGNNIRNTGAIVFNAELTPLFGVEVGYENSLFDYDTSGAVFTSPTNVIPSFSGTSDALDHTFHLDTRWQIQPQTTGVVGYQYRQVNYTGNEVIGFDFSGNALFSKSRDSRTHYAYVGAEHVFTPDLSGVAKVGASFVDYYNDPQGNDSVSPYVNISASYTYAPESYVQGGFSYDHNSTDVVGPFTIKGLTQSQESATLFATINHRIVPNLFAALNASYQYGTFVGGQFDSQHEKDFLIGLNLRYQFIRYLSAELGYDYTNVSSDTGRSYDRNRFYLGVTGSY